MHTCEVVVTFFNYAVSHTTDDNRTPTFITAQHQPEGCTLGTHFVGTA